MTETQTPQRTMTERVTELSDDVLESVEAGRKSAIEAVRKFVDEVTPVLADQSRRTTVIDAALDLVETLVTTRIEFLRSVVRSAGHTLDKE
jgi:hypothetical protein